MSTRETNPWAALGALCTGFFMVLLDTTIVSIAIPSMLRGLCADLNAVIWAVSVYLLAYAVPMLFTSRLGDRVGPKRVFLAGLVVFTGASLWCGLSGSVGMLIAARAVQGFGAALLTPQTLAFIGHLFPPAKRGSAMGVWAGVAGLGTIAGPLLGGLLVDRLGWAWVFFVNVPIGVVALVLTWRLVPDWRPKHAHSFDVPGVLLAAAGLAAVIFGVQNGQKYAWGKVVGNVSVFEIIGLGVALLVGFVLWQRANRKEPLLPLEVFGNRTFSAGTFAFATIGFALIGMFLPLVVYVQSVLELTPTEAGLLLAPVALVSTAVGPFVGRVSDKVEGKYLVMAGLAALAAGLGLFAAQASPASAPWALVPALVVCGLGFGLALAPVSNATMSSVEPRLVGTASGVFNTARQVGGVLGSAAVGVLLQARIAASVTVEAATAAASVPPEYRARFVAEVTGAASSAGEFGSGGAAPPVSGLPADLAARWTGLVTQAVRNGLADAARQSVLLPVAVLVLGILAAAAMRRNAPAHEETVPAS
ncbi:DHA2 family efflux MFS transporter permease subunit [Amycolatopsis sp. NPDC051061]|uniref:DHA2 family efflux MFS transporter permease subunit n=1 Tax=Amycolatopsis sp. NPDC051061 TaxID=3155042 RepID=UPI003429CA99